MAGPSNVIAPVFPHHRARIPLTMTELQWLKTIEENPIGDGLDSCRDGFKSICKIKGILCLPDSLDQLDDGGIVR